MGASRGPVLLIDLQRDGDEPLHEQLERRLREDIRSGRLPAGQRLPSSRGLAGSLGISRGVVTEAYGQLAAEGYLTTSQGAPVRVAPTVRGAPAPAPARSLQSRFAYDLRPGIPDPAGFPGDAWLRSLRAAWRDGPLDAVADPDPRGLPGLRAALANHLVRVRGAAADPEHIVVTGGFRQAFSLLCRWLASQGIERVAVEEPGWHPHRLAIEQAGLEVVPVAVDAEGIRVTELEASGVEVVVVTPAHQFPTGVALSRDRRAALVDWAEDADRLVVEDDYDSELRYDRAVLGALQGLAAERVIHIGSVSKRLAPGLRLGWMLVPSWLSWALASAKTVEDGGTDVLAQLALRDFVERGELDRHSRRMRSLYAARREALLAAIAREFPRARVRDGAAGLFTLVELPAGAGESRIVAAAAERGVGVEPLGLHRWAPGGPAGLVVGYGALAPPALARAVALLAAASR